MAPVINLSGSEDFDPLRVTDAVASEWLTFPNITVIPVNLTLGALARAGKTRVETPADALQLAREFGADATIVTAVTEYDPYEPPRIGLIMQWYSAAPPGAPTAQLAGEGTQPAAANEPPITPDAQVAGPRFQVQRVFNAADAAVLDQLEDFAEQREGHGSPYGWRKHYKAQELFVRFCSWSVILAMNQLWAREGATATSHGTERCTRAGAG